MGAGAPSNSTCVPARSIVENSALSNCMPAGLTGPRPVPKIVTTSPGETAPVP